MSTEEFQEIENQIADEILYNFHKQVSDLKERRKHYLNDKNSIVRKYYSMKQIE